MSRENALPLSPYPVCTEQIPAAVLREGNYEVRFARHPQELDAIQRLRFEVFNLELGEGLESSYETGRDVDEFDATCHHLMVFDRRRGKLVGSYRMQTVAMAEAHSGFYSAGLFDLSTMPGDVRAQAMETGRACVAASHRSTIVLFLLWKGLAAYVSHNDIRYLFGCCSLTSQDAAEGWRVMRYLERRRHLHTQIEIQPQPEQALARPENEGLADDDVRLPALFRTYLRYGSKVCGPPAIDREFKTIDYLVILDVESLSARTRRMFFA